MIKLKCIEIQNLYENNPEFLNIFAVILFELKEYNHSIEKWKKAIGLNSNYFRAYENLANAFLNLKKYHDALEYFNKAIEVNPEAFQIYNNIGNILTKLNKFKEALDFYDKAINIKPDNILVTDDGCSTLKLCDFGSAKRLVPGEPNVAYICTK